MKARGFVIKDIRDKKIYFDDSSFTRNFEEVLKSNTTLEQAKQEYPDIIDCRK